MQAESESQIQRLGQKDQLALALEIKENELKSFKNTLSEKDDEIYTLKQQELKNEKFVALKIQEINVLQKQLDEKSDSLLKTQQQLVYVQLQKSVNKQEEVDGQNSGTIEQDFERYDEKVRSDREELANLKLINLRMQDQIKEAKTQFIIKSKEFKTLQNQVAEYRTQIANLTDKQRADHRAYSKLQEILHERQIESQCMRKQYLVVEQALKGTSYVNDIQERINKIQTDDHIDPALCPDVDQIVQIDKLKQKLS